MKQLLLPWVVLVALLCGCGADFPNQDPRGQMFPAVSGQTLEQQDSSIPGDFAGRNALLLIGYVQDAQFDIDRWLIGLDATQTDVDTYELPTIAGMFPRMFKTRIDSGMRRGIPKALWKGVITIYADGEKIQQFTGNQNPNNARVVLLNEQGEIVYFYDQGFAVSALNELREVLQVDAQSEIALPDVD